MTPEDDLRGVVCCPGPMGIFEQGLALQERGWLGAVALDHYYDLDRPPWSWLADGRVKSFLRKRNHPALDARLVRVNPLPELVARLGVRFGRGEHNREKWINWVNARFDHWVASWIGVGGNLAIGYESSSLFTFRRARELGLPRVLYQPIACAEFARDLLGEEKERFPELADTIRYCWHPEEELERKREERALADAVVCASRFTKDSLVGVGVPADKIHVEPYGVDQGIFSPSRDKFPRFSIIWGSSFTQTKGIGYLLKALEREPVAGAELVLAGYPYGSDPVAPYEPRVRARRLGRVPRVVLAGQMRRCHAHVFPTLLEGFGRNIIEAMASGLPVITTPHCAGPDLIEDGVTGFIVPIRDVDAICERLAWVHDNPEAAVSMGEEARRRVAGLTQPDYRRRFAGRVRAVWEASRGGPGVTGHGAAFALTESRGEL